MQKLIKRKFLITTLVMYSIMTTSCKKNNLIVDSNTPAAIGAHFIDKLPDGPDGYYYSDAGNKFTPAPRTFLIHNVGYKPATIILGLTYMPNSSTTVGLTYSSISGAINGTQYTAPSSVTFLAGKPVQTFELNGKYADYANGRIDTVKIKINKSTIPTVLGEDSLTYYISKFCPIDLDTLSGDFTNTINYANNTQSVPYTSSVINLSSDTTISKTKAQGVFSQLLYKTPNGTTFPLNELAFEIDWTDESNYKLTITGDQEAFVNGTNTYYANTSTSQISTFSMCAQTYVLYLDFVNVATGAILYSGYKIILKR